MKHNVDLIDAVMCEHTNAFIALKLNVTLHQTLSTYTMLSALSLQQDMLKV